MQTPNNNLVLFKRDNLVSLLFMSQTEIPAEDHLDKVKGQTKVPS